MEEVCANDSNPVFNLTKAVKAVQNGMKVSHAASKYSIPASILFNRISAIRHKKKMSGQPTNLSPESHSIVNSENLSPESHSIANSEEPDEYGILVNDKKYNCKAKPPFNSVYVSEILAVALRLVLQGQTTTKEAASLYGIKHKTLNRKLRHIKRIQIKKLGSNPVQLPMALKKLKCYRQRNSSSPYPQLSASNSILNTMKRMTMMNGLTFPQPLYDCIVKLEQGVDFREMIHYYSLNMRVTVKVIRFLKRAKKSSRVWCGIISNKIEDLLPQISAPDSTPSSPRNSLTPSQTTNQSLASPSASQSYTTQDLSKACELIRNGESIKGAALKFHIPYTTLYNYQKLDSQKKKDQQEAVKFSERKGSPSPSMSSSPSSSSALTGNLEGLAGKLVGGMKQSQVSESQKGKSSKSLLCLFCHGKTGNEVELGKLHILNQVVVHYFCLLFSSALEQNGEDDEGILGFLPKDILKELNRGKKLKCVHCGEKGATIGCYSKNCKRTYHFPCGLKHHAQFVFTDNFRSVCSKHRKFQTGNNRGEEVECPICLQFMVADPKYAVWSPCCQKSSWFHKLCIQKLALNAGYFFKCPLCNDKSTFVPEMLQQGIYVPEQDASWELEPNAYHELLERPIRCDAPTCTCPSGRKNDEEGTNWEVVLCNLCGSTGVHVSCGKLRRAQPEWNCHTCTAMLHESALRAEQEKRDRYRRNRTTFESDDESEDEVSFTPSKRRRLQSPSQSSVAVRLKYCSSYDQDVDVGSDSDSNGKESASDSARPSSSSLSCRMAEVGSDNEEVFVPRGIRGDVVIADLVAQGLTPLSDALKELQDYAEGLPLKLVKSRFDETTFLHSLNEYSSSETSEQPVAYTVTKDHLRRFVRCTFTYDQMRLLRKVFELCFIINAIKTKISRYQKDVRNDPFKKRARNSFLMKKMKCLQNHLINLLTQAKTVNLLEGDSTWTRLASSAINHKPLDVKTDADPPNQTMSTSSAAASTHNDEPSTSSTVRYAFLKVVAPNDEARGLKREKVMTCHPVARQVEGEKKGRSSSYISSRTKKTLLNNSNLTSTPTRKSLRLQESSSLQPLPSVEDLDTILEDIEAAEKSFLREFHSQDFDTNRDSREKENWDVHRGSPKSLLSTDPCHSQHLPPSTTSYPFSTFSPSTHSTSSDFNNVSTTASISPLKDLDASIFKVSGASPPSKCSPLRTSPLQNRALLGSPPSSRHVQDVGTVLSQSKRKDLNGLRTPTSSSRLARNLFGIHRHSPSSSPDRSSSKREAVPLPSSSPTSRLGMGPKRATQAQSKCGSTRSQKRSYHKKKDTNKYIQPTISSYFQIRSKSK